MFTCRGRNLKVPVSWIARSFVLEFAPSHKFQHMPSYVIGVTWCHVHASFLFRLILDWHRITWYLSSNNIPPACNNISPEIYRIPTTDWTNSVLWLLSKWWIWPLSEWISMDEIMGNPCHSTMFYICITVLDITMFQNNITMFQILNFKWCLNIPFLTTIYNFLIFHFFCSITYIALGVCTRWSGIER